MRGHHLPLDYHASLLSDPVRVDAYDRAIRALVRPGDVVLDMGSGTGLLAMLAARCGAARVHAVESASVVRVCRALVRANGLGDVIVVHEADLVDMAPVEPVDLVIGEWLGRFVVDDEMLDAVGAAARWLAPHGRTCPRGVELSLGLGGRAIPAVQRWRTPVRGLDLAPAEAVALHTAYPGRLAAGDLLGPGIVAHRLDPRRPDPWPPCDVVLSVARPGTLHSLVGWWTAELAPDVSLTTAPGTPTHWGQYQWPLPPVDVEPGDRVEVHLALDPNRSGVWRWRVRVCRGDAVLLDHAADSVQADAVPGPPSPPVGDAIRRSNSATAALARGEIDRAVDGALAATRGRATAEQACILQENLGLALVNAGRLHDAVDAFLASLVGGPRPQALRFLVGCALRLGWSDAGAAWRETYEQVAGPWTDPFVGE